LGGNDNGGGGQKQSNLVCLSDHCIRNGNAPGISHDIDFKQIMVQKKYIDQNMKQLLENQTSKQDAEKLNESVRRINSE